ncbi:MAG: kinase, partial [Thermoplasmata archaeon]|nr:kinase [Thermoplasmata archaeon]
MIILKLGGSVITQKRDYATLNKEMVDTISEELASLSREVPLIIVHGAGSFGHILAKRYSLNNPEKGPELTMRIAKVQRDVRELNLLLLKNLIYRGIPAVSVPPSICA